MIPVIRALARNTDLMYTSLDTSRDLASLALTCRATSVDVQDFGWREFVEHYTGKSTSQPGGLSPELVLRNIATLDLGLTTDTDLRELLKLLDVWSSPQFDDDALAARTFVTYLQRRDIDVFKRIARILLLRVCAQVEHVAVVAYLYHLSPANLAGVKRSGKGTIRVVDAMTACRIRYGTVERLHAAATKKIALLHRREHQVNAGMVDLMSSFTELQKLLGGGSEHTTNGNLTDAMKSCNPSRWARSACRPAIIRDMCGFMTNVRELLVSEGVVPHFVRDVVEDSDDSSCVEFGRRCLNRIGRAIVAEDNQRPSAREVVDLVKNEMTRWREFCAVWGHDTTGRSVVRSYALGNYVFKGTPCQAADLAEIMTVYESVSLDPPPWLITSLTNPPTHPCYLSAVDVYATVLKQTPGDRRVLEETLKSCAINRVVDLMMSWTNTSWVADVRDRLHLLKSTENIFVGAVGVAYSCAAVKLEYDALHHLVALARCATWHMDPRMFTRCLCHIGHADPACPIRLCEACCVCPECRATHTTDKNKNNS